MAEKPIDASGALIHSVSHAVVGDGFQYPYEPRLDITQTYDGSGAPAKRQQISRLPGIVDEFGNPGEPMEDTQTTYYIKSSVLGGATVAEIGGGNIIYIYANGERIAREFWGNVTFEHHNPVTGSWLTSHGHSSYRTTAREERDPRGAETPLSNPFAYANSYVEWKFSSPLFIEGGDPFDYKSGLMIDGMPVSGAEFARRAGSGSLGVAFSGAISGLMPILPFGVSLFGYDRPIGWGHDEEGPELDWETSLFSSSGQNRSRRQQPDPQKPPLNPFLVNRIKQELEDSDCAKFAKTILDQLAPGKGRNLIDVFDAFLTQSNPHDLLTRVKPTGCWSEACVIGNIKDSTAAVWARRVDVNQTKADADNIVAELFHLARMDGAFTDKQLANAAHRTIYANDAANYLAPSANVFDPAYKPGGWNEQNQFGYSVYFHTIQRQHCGFRPPNGWK